MIVVIGGSGRIGRQLIRLLGERGIACRAMLREPARAGALGRWAEIVGGDLADPTSLAAALRGGDKLYLASAVGPNQVAEQANAVTAALKAGIRHIVRVSTEAVSYRRPMALSAWHHETEQLIEASGLAYTHLRPCNFMHNMLVFAPTIAREGVIRAPFGRGRMTLVDVGDIAAVAAAALTEPGHDGQAYRITGAEWLSYDDIARLIQDGIGRPVRYEPISAEAARRGVTEEGYPPWLIDDLIAMYEYLAQDETPPTTEIVQRVAKKPPRLFADFVAEHAEDFRAGRSGH